MNPTLATNVHDGLQVWRVPDAVVAWAIGAGGVAHFRERQQSPSQAASKLTVDIAALGHNRTVSSGRYWVPRIGRLKLQHGRAAGSAGRGAGDSEKWLTHGFPEVKR
jgi:hypothetical protein